MLSSSQIEALHEIVHYLNLHEFHQASHRNAQFHPLYVTALKVKATYFNYKLSSTFQPVRNIRTGLTEAHEAFINIKPITGSAPIEPLSPNAIFLLPFDQAGITYIDRLARTVNTLNFLAQDGKHQLHLNVHPNHLRAVSGDHGKVFEGILRQCGIDTAQITLEVPEYAVHDKSLLQDALRAWQEKGYRIAIDNFGRDHHDSSRLEDLRPDTVKIDRNFLIATEKSAAHHEALNALLRQSELQGFEIIATGIETPSQLDFVRQLGIEKVQGYLLGRPAGFIDTEESHIGNVGLEDDDNSNETGGDQRNHFLNKITLRA